MTDKPGLDYAAAGVDYGTLDASKILAQKAARATAGNLARHGAAEIEASRGESAYLVEVGGVLIASITECLGTKSLVADAAREFSGRTHYDTIAQDTIAMAVNDLVTVGATPLSTHAYWSAGSSDWFADKERMRDLVRGWQAACDVCGMAWGGGETPALGGVVEADRIDLAASCVGIVKAAPTYYYKAGVAFLSWLNGHQTAFQMVGGLHAARSLPHLSEIVRRANASGALERPELAAARWHSLLTLNGIDVASAPVAGTETDSTDVAGEAESTEAPAAASTEADADVNADATGPRTEALA
jgi:hypothetical protein